MLKTFVWAGLMMFACGYITNLVAQPTVYGRCIFNCIAESRKCQSDAKIKGRREGTNSTAAIRACQKDEQACRDSCSAQNCQRQCTAQHERCESYARGHNVAGRGLAKALRRCRDNNAACYRTCP
jgi:hypothetical protein